MSVPFCFESKWIIKLTNRKINIVDPYRELSSEDICPSHQDKPHPELVLKSKLV